MRLPRPRRPPRRSRATAADRIAVAPRSARAPLVEPAPAKINLTLEIRGRRGDGYHELQSLVVFARVGDRLRLVPGKTLALDLRGPLAAALGGAGENLVLKAARELAARIEGLTPGRIGRHWTQPRSPAPAASSWHSCACATTIWSKPRSRWRRSSPKCWRSCARCPNASSRGCRAPARLALQSSGPRAPRSRPRE